MNRRRIPTLLGLAILIIGIAFGVLLINNKQVFKLGASPELIPKDVRVSNLTDTGFTVSWITDSQTYGFVKLGKGGSLLNRTALPGKKDPSFSHWIKVENLETETAYDFKISSSSYEFDNNGIPWQVKTAQKISETPVATIVSGSIISQLGMPFPGALIYLAPQGGSLLSTVSGDDGGWLIPLSVSRKLTLDRYLDIDEENTLLEISVQAGPKGVASALIYPVSAKPAPPIKLGEVHNFKTINSQKEENIPEATIDFPPPSTTKNLSSKQNKEVILNYPKENDIVLTTALEFLGQAPSGKNITITLLPNFISTKIKANSQGYWNWTPGVRLPTGEYGISLQWLDNNGTPQELISSFSIQASQ